MVLADVGGDGRGKPGVEVRAGNGIGCGGVEVLAEAGGGDVLMEAGEQVNAGALGRRQGEFRAVEELGREREVGAGDDDPLGEGEQLGGRAPVAQGEEAVGASDCEEGCAGRFPGERGEGVDGVVGFSCGARAVERREGEARVGGERNTPVRERLAECERDHGDAVLKGRGCGTRFERLTPNGGEEDAVEGEGVGGGGGHAQMAEVDGVEGSAEQSHAHGGYSSSRVPAAAERPVRKRKAAGGAATAETSPDAGDSGHPLPRRGLGGGSV